MSLAASASAHTLEQRHKLSLARFSEKQQCITDWIQQLEESVLPTLEELDGVYDAGVLEAAWSQYREIDEGTAKLDSGELRSLRLLAKAASQKELNSEDTDLIEITLNSLFALDKLLHLLRLRKKTLHLLQARITWNKQVQQVEKDLTTLLQDGLPRFLAKARWSTPKEASSPSSSKPRLSNGQHSSPSSLRGTTTSSSMARQMRSEILSLDLASLTSRIHTLVYSTLSASGKTLDIMIDTSPAPIPEKYLDFQDELEQKVKDGVKGIPEFCSALGKQWKDADEIWWTSTEGINNLEALERDTNEATLKLPTKEKAEAFEERLAKTRATVQRLQEKALEKFASPIHPVQVSDQNKHNELVKIALLEVVEKAEATLAKTATVVQGYRNAATALESAHAYQASINKLAQDLKASLADLVPTALDPSCLEKDEIPPPSLDAISALVQQANNNLLPQASDVLQALQKAGIDPNIRRSVHESVMALASTIREADSFTEAETKRRVLAGEAKRIWHTMLEQRDAINKQIAELQECLRASRWTENTPRHTEFEISVDSNTPSTEASNQLDTLLAGLEASMPEQGADLLRKLQAQRTLCLEAEARRQALWELLGLVRKQAETVESVRKEQETLASQSHDFITSLRDEDFNSASLDTFAGRQKALAVDVQEFVASLATRAPFVSSSSTPHDLGLAATDETVRACVNQLASELGSLAEESKTALVDFEAAFRHKQRLHELLSERQILQQRLDGAAEELALQVRHEALIKLQADIAALSAALQSDSFAGSDGRGHLSSSALADLETMQADLQNSSIALQESIQNRIEETQAAMSAAEAEAAELVRLKAAEALEKERRKKLEEEVSVLEKDVEDLRRQLEAVQARCRDETKEVSRQTFFGEPGEEKILQRFNSTLQQISEDLGILEAQCTGLEDRSHYIMLTDEDDDLRLSVTDLLVRSSSSSTQAADSLQSLSESIAHAKESFITAVAAKKARQEEEERIQLVNNIQSKLAHREKLVQSGQQSIASLEAQVVLATTGMDLQQVELSSLSLPTQVEEQQDLKSQISSLSPSTSSAYSLTQLQERLQALELAESEYTASFDKLRETHRSNLSRLQAGEEERERLRLEAAGHERKAAEKKALIAAEERKAVDEMLDRVQQAESTIAVLEDGMKEIQDRLASEEPAATRSSLDLAEAMQDRLASSAQDLDILKQEIVERQRGMEKDDQLLLGQELLGVIESLERLREQLQAVQQNKDNFVSEASRKIEAAKTEILAHIPAEVSSEALPSSRHSRQTTEDVFGPEVYTSDGLSRSTTADSFEPDLHGSHSPSESSAALLDIRTSLAELDFDRFLRPLPKSLSLQLLPTLKEAEAAQRQISLTHAHLDDISASIHTPQDLAQLEEIDGLVKKRSREASRVMQLATFAAAAEKTDTAISELLDAIDEKENLSASEALDLAGQKMEQMKESGKPVRDDPRVSKRIEQLDEIWLELQSLAQREQFASPSVSRSVSRSSSVASDLSVLSSRRSVSAYHPPPRSASRVSTASMTPRLPSSTASSRIPVSASPRVRTTSLVSASKPSLSKLPVPSSPAITGGFLAPRSTSRKNSRETAKPPVLPTPLLRKSLSNVGLNSNSPPGSRRSSNRRSSGAYKPDEDERPNRYRPNNKRKLDIAVGRIVNTMNVPVTITPAEAFQDLSGKYWIGDPPKLYYARILRSKTVMLRVGGGWQELSSFLTTHYNAVFSAHTQHTSPQDSPSSDANRSWLTASSFKASLPTYIPTSTSSAYVQRDNPTPRAVSHDHRYALSRTFSNGSSKKTGMTTPADLTSLLVKSNSRSPPTVGMNQQQRSKSASIPWRI